MKKKSRDFLTITMAMLTVLLCGYGIGYLVGEKKGLRSASERNSISGMTEDWGEKTMVRLNSRLSLTPGQEKIAQESIGKASLKLRHDLQQVRDSRIEALRSLYLNLAPHLDDSQLKELEELQSELDQSP